jgi:hypothetical protein
VNVTRVGCGVTGGARLCYPIGGGVGVGELHRAKGAGEGLRVPQRRPRCQDDDCRGGARGSRRGARGGVNEAPACCVGGLWNGAVTKAGWCCGGWDGGAPVDGPGHMLMVPVQEL